MKLSTKSCLIGKTGALMKNTNNYPQKPVNAHWMLPYWLKVEPMFVFIQTSLNKMWIFPYLEKQPFWKTPTICPEKHSMNSECCLIGEKWSQCLFSYWSNFTQSKSSVFEWGNFTKSEYCRIERNKHSIKSCLSGKGELYLKHQQLLPKTTQRTMNVALLKKVEPIPVFTQTSLNIN